MTDTAELEQAEPRLYECAAVEVELKEVELEAELKEVELEVELQET
jgi:hypothetical protein